MKKAITLTLTVLFSLTLLFTGCGKYEEGPGLSLRSKKGRLTGTWTVEKAISTTGSTTLDFTSLFTGVSYTYDKDGKYTVTSGSVSSSGTWVFGDKKETIITTDASNNKDTSTIFRLANKEFWIKDVSGGTTTEIHFMQ